MGTLVGADWGSRIGPDRIIGVLGGVGAPATYAMAGLNTGWAFRFTAPNTKDIASVRIAWNAVSAAGTVQVRIETVDATTGKPTGTLYDAAATVDITPTATVQTATFATLPTTGLTVGAEYAVVLITTVAGTTHTLRSHTLEQNAGRYPAATLQAADATTRSNFAEVSAAVGIVSLVNEDGNETVPGSSPYHTFTPNNMYGNGVTGSNLVAAQKIILGAAISCAGVELDTINKLGTPAGNLRCRIFDGSNNVVSGTTVTIDKDSLTTGATTKGCFVLFPAPVSLAAGTYRVAFDSLDSVNSTNCWMIRSGVPLVLAASPSNYVFSESGDNGATWTDSTTDVAPIALLVDSFTAASSGGGSPALGSNIIRGV